MKHLKDLMTIRCSNEVFSPAVKDNKHIRNNTILKQNRTVLKLITLRAKIKIKKTNTVDSDETAHYEPSHLDLQSVQNHLLFYLVLKCFRFYLLNLRCHCYVCACKYNKYLQPV